MAFKITKDYVEEGQHTGRLFKRDDEDPKEDDFTMKFKLYDDDGELYYDGVSTEGDVETEVAPLDWGRWNAGCTYMKVKNKETGAWEVL